ncbi:hypothetical protein [Xylanimonas ulmi]|uniref:Uncharacterized protein n=1 Tax=Xylanimonas ulmi TaxID=228973 RepID=A0A4Q7M623_9MICO|nr:hypothetical protein [Xylanibacterium ulmi]RZS62467.1 hypothetical protein EV386_2800 [Xylanibacterium ulmi]
MSERETTWEGQTIDGVILDDLRGEDDQGRVGYVRHHVGYDAEGLSDDDLRALIAAARAAVDRVWVASGRTKASMVTDDVVTDRHYVDAVLAAADVLAAPVHQPPVGRTPEEKVAEYEAAEREAHADWQLAATRRRGAWAASRATRQPGQDG